MTTEIEPIIFFRPPWEFNEYDRTIHYFDGRVITELEALQLDKKEKERRLNEQMNQWAYEASLCPGCIKTGDHTWTRVI